MKIIKVVALQIHSRRTENVKGEKMEIAEKMAVMPAYVIIVVNFAVLAIGLAITAFMKHKNFWWFLLAGWILLSVEICMTPIAINLAYEKMARNVDKKLVPISGKKILHAQAQIIYEDGKLKSITLVPGTTVP